MTFTALRALHAIIGDALDDIERIFAEADVDSDVNTDANAEIHTSRNQQQQIVSKAIVDNNLPSRSSDASSSTRPSLSESLYSTPSSISSHPYPRHPPSLTTRSHRIKLDFPSLDKPYDSSNPAEKLLSHPEVGSAINRIVAACGQMGVSVREPFLNLCDASLGVSLLSLTRLL